MPFHRRAVTLGALAALLGGAVQAQPFQQMPRQRLPAAPGQPAPPVPPDQMRSLRQERRREEVQERQAQRLATSLARRRN